MEGLQKSILIWRNRRSNPGNQYKTMTIQFNITETPGYGTYLDDAAGMPYGKTSEAISTWQEFFGYKPCLFKDGKVVGYLNPNDYSKFENGTSADITSGNAGDVMVEFPRRGIKISKYGTTITVSMTNNPNAYGYSYLAHSRGSEKKDYFYIGAYIGYTKSNNNIVKLYSLSGVTDWNGGLNIGYDMFFDQVRTATKNKGSGYMQLGFYQFLYLQCMYLLQFKGNLNSQEMVGYGWDSKLISYGDYSYHTTGSTNTYGMIYGKPDDNYEYTKIFGIEDLWSQSYCFPLENIYISSPYNAYISTDNSNFNNSAYGYSSIGISLGTGSSSGIITNVYGDNNLGFFPISVKSRDGSRKICTYFCDSGTTYGTSSEYEVISISGDVSNGGTGIFDMSASVLSTGGRNLCSRLSYV